MLKNTLAKNTIYKTILNICNIIIPIIIGPYILRVLDRSYYDIFNKLLADFQFFLIFGSLGIYNYGVREASKFRCDNEKSATFITEQFIIGTISNIIVAIVYVTISLLLYRGKSLQIILCIILSTQFVSNIFNVEWMNEASENYFFITIKSVSIRIIYLIAIFVLIRKGNDIIWYAILLCASAILNTAISFIFIKKHCKFSFKNLNFRQHFKPLILIFLIANISLLYSQSDKILLGNFVSSREVTNYQLAQFISGLIYGLMIPVVIVSVPRISNLIGNDKYEDALSIYKKSVTMFLLAFIPATIGMFFLSKEIIYIYGSENYNDCIFPLSMFAVSQFLAAGCYIFGDAMLLVCNKEKFLVCVNLIGGVINIFLDIILIVLKRFNSVSAILTLIIAYFIVDMIYYIKIKKLFKLKKLEFKFFNIDILKYLLFSILFIPIIIGVKYAKLDILLTAIISILLCVLLYVALLIIFKDKFMIGMLNKLFCKIKKKRGK